MAQYEERILNGLLDAYENSLLSRGENKVTIHITYSITKKTMPEYFNESSLAYEDIHACVFEMESRGFLKAVWKKGKEGHILHCVTLRDEAVELLYRYMKRTPRLHKEGQTILLLRTWIERYPTPVARVFMDYLIERIEAGNSVREYIELSDFNEAERLISSVSFIESNEKAYYMREFSILHFGDSKAFEGMLGKIGKVFRRFSERFRDMDVYEMLAEHSIYHTPNYVYLKGNIKLYFGAEDVMGINLPALLQGIGLSGEDLHTVRIEEIGKVKRVITIENQTTFFRWNEPDSVIIYLGGYHNSVRRELLHMIHQQIPGAEYLHFGDIDIGGFEIYEDLCRKTGILFSTYYMGIQELKQYKKQTKKLTSTDKKRLEILLEKKRGTNCDYLEVLEYMNSNDVKLEQECVEK